MAWLWSLCEPHEMCKKAHLCVAIVAEPSRNIFAKPPASAGDDSIAPSNDSSAHAIKTVRTVKPPNVWRN